MFADNPRQPFELFVKLFANQRWHFIELDLYRERMVREIFLFLSVSDLFVAHGTALMLCPCLDLREDRVIAMDQLPDLRGRFLHDGLFQLWKIRQHTNVPSTTFQFSVLCPSRSLEASRFVGRSKLLPGCSRHASSATHLSGPVPARNADHCNSCALTSANKETKPS